MYVKMKLSNTPKNMMAKKICISVFLLLPILIFHIFNFSFCCCLQKEKILNNDSDIVIHWFFFVWSCFLWSMFVVCVKIFEWILWLWWLSKKIDFRFFSIHSCCCCCSFTRIVTKIFNIKFLTIIVNFQFSPFDLIDFLVVFLASCNFQSIFSSCWLLLFGVVFQFIQLYTFFSHF